jgi:nucleotide-binding universal stress UspA family protein
MKEIVVGIDFSKSSTQALQYALKMAHAYSCDLKLVYVCKMRDKESRIIKDEKGIECSITKNFHKIIDEYQPAFSQRITFKILEGKIWEEVSNQAKYTPAGMIIIGAHGMSGYESEWIGNNAMKIVAHSEKPVLCVKKNFKPKNLIIEKVVIPIDHTRNTLQKIPLTLEIARKFNAQVNVLSIINAKQAQGEKQVEENTQKAMQWVIASGLRYINEKRTSDDSARATLEYAVRRNADLISIHTENENPQSYIMGNIPQQILNQSPVPVLTSRVNVFSYFHHDYLEDVNPLIWQ